MEQKEEEPKNKSASKTCCWIIFGLFGLIVVLFIAFFIIREFTNFGSGGKNSSKNQDEEDIALSKNELVNYFVELTTVYPGLNKPIKSMAWDKKVVTVSIADQAPEGADKVISDFITKFNSNSTSTQLERVSIDGDIKIYFQKDTHGAAGSSGPSSGADYIIDHADIKLSEEAAYFENSLSAIFDHEMLHALGFTGHYTGSVCRLLSMTTCGSHFTINEERLIQMLYSEGLPIGSDEVQIRDFFQNWTPK